MALIASRRFLPLFLTQFLGAFNDNVLKNALVILITYKIAYETGDNAQVLVTIAAGVFILPFFLFSATAGQLADKYERTRIVRIVKIVEILIMLLASLGFIAHNSWYLIIVLFAAGMHSTFFGPLKYALLPQLLAKSELINANAYISGATFIAILLGTICGGLLILNDSGEFVISLILISIAVLGYITCILIPYAPAPDPGLKININILQETGKIIKYAKANQRVFIAVLGISWFWLLGATFLSQFPNFVKNVIHAEAKVVTIFLLLFSIGVALGSFICSTILRGKITSKFVPYAALGISIFTLDLYFACGNQMYFNINGLLSYQVFLHMQPSIRIMLDILLIAVSAGIFIVPLYAIVQHESNSIYLARIIAANNVLNALFMVVSAAFTLSMLSFARGIPDVFFTIAIVNIFVGWMIYNYLVVSEKI